VANGTDSEGGYKLAEKIRRLVEEKLFEYGDIKIKITASFGVHCMKNIVIDLGEFIELADKNLYEAKRRGRNKTIG
jgi:diguanylate cyclase (GGDEF)-like protein